MDYTFIYALTCHETNVVRYTGKANNPKKRYYAHLRKYNTACSHKINWVQSLLKRVLKPKLEIIKKVPMDEWKKWERYYINIYKNKGKLTNCKDGGEGSFRGNKTSFKKGIKPWNTGTRMKKACVVCSELFEVSPTGSKKYKCCSKKCRIIYIKNNPNKGVFKKGQTSWNKGKTGYSTSKRGCKIPEDVKKRISETLTGRFNGGSSKVVIQINNKTKEIIADFPSAAEAYRQTGISSSSILNVTNNFSKTAGGYIWRKRNLL